ncbi:hypothetical protein CLCR_05307 [Cladophialophora carrionii]|uniref:Uncharacterized protein n=1 Tax=Cladophialophora carrionii TaxID=86049 RepID=A0A1C1CLJ2_9EURO|nr:hypothetical protein CLCR_05307 [Cladophialophora carrionii]
MQAIYKDLYPSPESDPAEEDVLVQKRMEVAKSAPRLEREKKCFTAVNEQAAKEREEAGVKARDFAHALPVGCRSKCQKLG